MYVRVGQAGQHHPPTQVKGFDGFAGSGRTHCFKRTDSEDAPIADGERRRARLLWVQGVNDAIIEQQYHKR
jgi:hypothetical protein